ncbi:hypothetical protein GOODEAATRI_020001, partial [Goodea atripinnis]
PSFVSGVKLFNSGNYNSSIEHLEEALRLYLQEYDLCQAECEGIGHFSSDRDFYALLAASYCDSNEFKIMPIKHIVPSVIVITCLVNVISVLQEALRYYNQTVTQKQMLTLVGKYLEMNDEDFRGPEENGLLSSESPDAEFEGVGDYEESIFANWRQMKGKGDAGKADI